MTFIAMNRFRVALGKEAEFEEVWRGRQSDLPPRPASWFSISCAARATRPRPCSPRIPSGRRAGISRTGPGRKPFAAPIPARRKRRSLSGAAAVRGLRGGLRNPQGRLTKSDSRCCDNNSPSRNFYKTRLFPADYSPFWPRILWPDFRYMYSPRRSGTEPDMG